MTGTPGIPGRRDLAPALGAVLLASGFAGLGYELVWTRLFAVSLGHEIAAVLAVVAAFFSGLALGAAALGPRAARSDRPERWYAALEGVVGAWSLLLLVALPAFHGLVAGTIGPEASPLRQWTVAFTASFLALLPATAAMGATLPAMERIFAKVLDDRRAVAGLYAANTLGAVLGILVTTWLLAPRLGFSVTVLLLAGLNGVCALATLRIVPAAGEGGAGAPAPAPARALGPGRDPRAALVLFVTGLLGIAFEVVAVRVLSQQLEDTVYTFAGLLAMYLLGTAAGAALYQRLGARAAREPLLSWLLSGLALACLFGFLVVWEGRLVYGAFRAMAPGAGAVLGELAVAAVVFGPATVLMGATFGHLVQQTRGTIGVGPAVALNTFGGALAPPLFGVFLLPRLGTATLLLLVALAYLPFAVGRSRTRWVPAAVVAGALVPVLLLTAPGRVVDVPPGGELLEFREGVLATAAVVEDGRGTRQLRVNNHFVMGATGADVSDRRQAHIPLLLHPDPRDALFLGLGTGASFAAVAPHPDVRATAVELIPELPALMHWFGPSRETVEADPRLHLVTADARRYVRSVDPRFDVIVAEVFHPSRDGAGALYTVEHFEAVRDRLAQGGLFCQWLPLFQLDLETLRLITRTFLAVFPDAQAHLAHFSLERPLVGLIGRTGPSGFEAGWLGERVRKRALAEDLLNVRLDSDFALVGGLLAGGDDLAEWAGAGPLNRDDRPLVTYRAPDFAYTAPDPPWVRVLALVEALRPEPGDLSVDPNSAFGRRLVAYWRARDAFLAAGVDVRPVGGPEAVLAQVREPLLSALRTSPDFSPALLPLLELARAIRPDDPETAFRLLREVQQAAPGRPEVDRTGRALFGS